MISINSRGDFCHGVGGNYFNINNVQIQPGATGGWITDDVAAFIDGGDDWKVAIYDVPTRRITRGHPQYPAGVVATGLFAGGGMYASWPGVGGVLASTGWSYPDSGLLGVGPDGAIAYKPSYTSNGPTVVREQDGSEWQLTPNHAYDLQLLGQHRALFNDSVLGFTVVGIPMPQRLPGANWFPHAFLLEGQWWFGCQNEHAGVIAHPFDNPTRGYVIVPPGQDAWPAFRALDHYTLLCVWANSQAEQAGQCTPRRFDVRTDPLVDIVVPPDPPDPPDPPEPDPPRAPVIVVESWNSLMKAGVPWKLDTTIKTNVDTNLVITKDAADKLWLRAVNVAGSNQTGMTRQLTVEGPDDLPPDPPDPTPPATLGRFWLQPNIGSLDMLDIFADVSRLTAAHVDVFSLYVQEILADESYDQIGPNTYPNLVAHDVFRKLAQAGIPLNIEMGSVKPGDCDAQNAIRNMQTAVQRVTDAGGVVAAFAMDEPLTANQVPAADGGCQQPLDQIAATVSNYMRAVWALGPIQVRWLEAWPEVSFEDHETFLSLLAQNGTPPNGWHADIDHNRAKKEGKDVAQFIRDCQALADRYGIAFGCFINSTVDPIATDPEHDANLVTLAHKIFTIHPTVAHVHVASWAHRVSPDPTHKSQNVPNNLSEDGLLQTFAEVRTVFGDTPPPEPEIDMTFVTLIGNEQTLAVTEIRPSQEKGSVYLVLADPETDKDGTHEHCSFSCQPPAKNTTEPIAGWRVEGTDGEWERAVRNGNYAVYTVEGVRYAWPFTLVRK